MAGGEDGTRFGWPQRPAGSREGHVQAGASLLAATLWRSPRYRSLGRTKRLHRSELTSSRRLSGGQTGLCEPTRRSPPRAEVGRNSPQDRQVCSTHRRRQAPGDRGTLDRVRSRRRRARASDVRRECRPRLPAVGRALRRSLDDRRAAERQPRAPPLHVAAGAGRGFAVGERVRHQLRRRPLDLGEHHGIR